MDINRENFHGMQIWDSPEPTKNLWKPGLKHKNISSIHPTANFLTFYLKLSLQDRRRIKRRKQKEDICLEKRVALKIS